jgi:maltose O-acetyltransferase
VTEREKMLRGELYNAADRDLVLARRRARNLTKALNDSRDDDEAVRARIIAELFGSSGAATWIEPPFYCDYGANIHLGSSVFFNFNCVVLDVARVDIGDNVLIGPHVQIYTATHPLDAATRRAGLELGKPIRIGSDVWIGGSAVINPGVSVGARSVIGAGSVVTRDIGEDVFAAGNPCRVIRTLVAPTFGAPSPPGRGLG